MKDMNQAVLAESKPGKIWRDLHEDILQSINESQSRGETLRRGNGEKFVRLRPPQSDGMPTSQQKLKHQILWGSVYPEF